MGLAPASVSLGAGGGAQPAALQLLAAPCHADADRREGGGVHDSARAEVGNRSRRKSCRAPARAPSPAGPVPIRRDRPRPAPPGRRTDRARRPAESVAARRGQRGRARLRSVPGRSAATSGRGQSRAVAGACRASTSGDFTRSRPSASRWLSSRKRNCPTIRGRSPPGKPLGRLSEFSAFGWAAIHSRSKLEETSHADADDDPRRFRQARNGANPGSPADRRPTPSAARSS